ADVLADVLATDDAFIEAIIAQIGEVNPDLVTLEAKINALITGVTYYNSVDGTDLNLEFNTVPSLVDNTFGGDREGAISFAVSKTGEGVATDVVRVRISPASATLTKEDIFLIDNPGSKDINKYVTVKGVSPFKEQYSTPIARADAKGGVYDITFTSGDNYEAKAFDKLTQTSNNSRYVNFAIAVGNADRYVTTGFNTNVSAVKEPNTVYNDLSFTINGNSDYIVGSLQNRYGANNSVKEKVWATKTDKNNVSPDSNTRDATAAEDDRHGSGQKVVPDNIGAGVTVILNPSPLAYYIDFDTNGATAAELESWKKADIEGLNQVYGGGATATITVNDPALEGKTVGYRVYAVNYNGTLVDPDGRAFYASYSGETLKGSSLDFVYTVTTSTKAELAAIAPTVGVSAQYKVTSTKVAITYPEGLDPSKVSTAELKIGDLGYGYKDVLRYASESGAPVYSWADTKYLALNDIDLKGLNDEGEAYNGTLLLQDASGHTLATYDVTLTKVLPNKFPVDGLKLHDDVIKVDKKLTEDAADDA
ncbi:hypothetical protein EZS27_033954, partial [termite gut metagenome]